MARSVASDLKAGAAAALAASGPFTAVVPAASVFSGSVPAGINPPYVGMETTPLGVEFAGEVVTGGKFIDKQRLTVRVWASADDAEAALGPIVPLVLNVLGKETWTVADSTLMSSYVGEIVQVEDDDYNGNQVWRADIPFEVWLQRTFG